MSKRNTARGGDWITNCPICDADLQATGKTWYSNTRIKVEGGNLADVDLGDFYDYDPNYEIYCENDHDDKQILAAIK